MLASVGLFRAGIGTFALLASSVFASGFVRPEHISPAFQMPEGLGNMPWDEIQRLAQARHLQENKPTAACGEILGTYNTTEVQAFVEGALQPEQVVYGLQVRKICATCTDMSDPSTFCRPTDYGSNATFSGLLYLPLSPEDLSIASGTLVPGVFCHGTTTDAYPSVNWGTGYSETDFPITITVATGLVAILPDYMGFGESQEQAFRGYIIKKSYQTSSLPLVSKVETMLATETGCDSVLAKHITVQGYSEGGYVATVLAEGLNSIGYDIIRVEAGAGPYALSTDQLLDTIGAVAAGNFSAFFYGFSAILGAAFSSSYGDLPNFDQQNMVKDEVQPAIVDVVQKGIGTSELGAFVVNMTGGDIFSLFIDEIVDLYLTALNTSDHNPCRGASPPANQPALLCQALREQDVKDKLLTVDYPIHFCHSPDDTIVTIANVPDYNTSDLLTFTGVRGGHIAAGVACLQVAAGYFLTEFPTVQVPDAPCTASTLAPSLPEGATHGPTMSVAPTPAPGPSPTVGSPTSAANKLGYSLFSVLLACVVPISLF